MTTPIEDSTASLLKQVFPIWRQQIEFVRVQATETTMALLTSFMAVADELVKAALNSKDVSQDVSNRLTVLVKEVENLKLQGLTQVEEQKQRTARLEETVRDVFSSLVELTSKSAELSEFHDQIQANIEQIFLSLQNEDRLSQILQHVCDDMMRMEHACHGETSLSELKAETWLAHLKKTYTTAEEHAIHEGRSPRSESSSVDYF
ncbi:MAG: hypothetical protein ACK4F8_13590 [Aquabacterium sp.]